jgi:hypothetical protein
MKGILFAFLICGAACFGQGKIQKTYWHASAAVYQSNTLTSTTIETLHEPVELWREREMGAVMPCIQGGLGYRKNDRLSFQGGLQFARRGYLVDTISDASITKMKCNYSYLELPIVGRYIVSNAKSWQPFVSMGITPCILLSQATRYQRLGQTPWFDLDQTDNPKSLQLGLIAAVGAQKAIQEDATIVLSAEYFQQISALYDTPIQRRLYHIAFRFSIEHKF